MLISTYLVPIIIIFTVLLLWVVVESFARAFADRNPEWKQTEGTSPCGALCFCKHAQDCPKAKLNLRKTQS